MSELFENGTAMPTLKQIAVVLDVPMQRLASQQVGHKPIDGKVYDPKDINWDAVKKFIANRLEKTGYDSVEAVLEAAANTEVITRRGNHTKDPNSVWGVILDVEGSDTTPKRKGDLKVGDKIICKKTNEEFEVKYVDETIVVYAPISAEGKLTLSSAIGNRVFNNQYIIETAE